MPTRLYKIKELAKFSQGWQNQESNPGLHQASIWSECVVRDACPVLLALWSQKIQSPR